MHVVIVGCGRVGSGLARIIEDKGHSVAVVDKDPTAFRRLHEGFAGQQVVGVGFDRDRLEEAGVRNAVALAAVTNGDNSNILTARVARETFGVDRVVARIYDPRRAEIYQRLGIPTVATVKWTTDQVMRVLIPDQVASDWRDPNAEIALITLVLPDEWAGWKVEDLEAEGHRRVVGVTRTGHARIVGPQMALQEGDQVHLAVDEDGLQELRPRVLAARRERQADQPAETQEARR